jgi:uncharacterized surface protein with fasciclin (FAS1) repeats
MVFLPSPPKTPHPLHAADRWNTSTVALTYIRLRPWRDRMRMMVSLLLVASARTVRASLVAIRAEWTSNGAVRSDFQLPSSHFARLAWKDIIMLRTAVLSVALSLSLVHAAHADSKAGTKTEAKAKADIVDTAVAAGSFKTLAKALTEAGLVETLKGKGPFTVFAPTDEAFAKLPKGTVEALLKDKKKLTAVLTYHVVAGKVMAADAAKLTTAKTVNGQSIKITAKDGVMIDDAKVTKADIEASNGVIHVIDKVILPK